MDERANRAVRFDTIRLLETLVRSTTQAKSDTHVLELVDI